MAFETYSCPECQAPLRSSPNLKPGDLVQCPRCRTQFPVPAPGTFQPPPGVTALPGPSSRDPNFSEAPLPSRPRFPEPEEHDGESWGRPKRPEPEWDEDYPRPSVRYYEDRGEMLRAVTYVGQLLTWGYTSVRSS
jgi:hypothetical protein